MANREYDEKTIVEIGYLLDGKYTGMGYASEAMHAIIEFAWEELELTELYCFIRRENFNSIKFARKLGFVYDGDAESEGIKYSVYKRKKSV